MTWRANMKGLEMQSTMMNLVRQRGCASKTFNGMACAVALGLAGFAITASPASALTAGANSALQYQLKQLSPIIEVVVRRGGAVRRTTVVGPRGNVASRTVVRRGAVVRPGVVRPGGWVRPANYYWRLVSASGQRLRRIFIEKGVIIARKSTEVNEAVLQGDSSYRCRCRITAAKSRIDRT